MLISSSEIFACFRYLKDWWTPSNLPTQITNNTYQSKPAHPITSKRAHAVENTTDLMRFLLGFIFFFALMQITTATSIDTGLVGYYPFDGNANDISGNGNHGVSHSATLSTDRFGIANNAYSFNGLTSYIEIENGNAFNFVNQFRASVIVSPVTA